MIIRNLKKYYEVRAPSGRESGEVCRKAFDGVERSLMEQLSVADLGPSSLLIHTHKAYQDGKGFARSCYYM